ncbi:MULTISPECIES: hypothetical protein [unclassified Streptomyces]|uniref:hypothetical protein n=1 Tax=unclassified Streptomyces TaxID=2593676 RepID=UPI00364E0C88
MGSSSDPPIGAVAVAPRAAGGEPGRTAVRGRRFTGDRTRSAAADAVDPAPGGDRGRAGLGHAVVPGAGHHLHEDRPEEVARAVLAVIGRARAGDAEGPRTP